MNTLPALFLFLFSLLNLLCITAAPLPLPTPTAPTLPQSPPSLPILSALPNLLPSPPAPSAVLSAILTQYCTNPFVQGKDMLCHIPPPSEWGSAAAAAGIPITPSAIVSKALNGPSPSVNPSIMPHPVAPTALPVDPAAVIGKVIPIPGLEDMEGKSGLMDINPAKQVSGALGGVANGAPTPTLPPRPSIAF